ncbi:MAG: YchF/TatD family DNA exonuclease, partial [Candidatus Adiutrix sp.]|nr:YchF/TatD family DNA exonuclease [Candidatus Adiutrix sp.]
LSPARELDYFVRDRAEDVNLNIGPALMAGRPVLADRYILSNVAYQSARGLAEETILKANAPFPRPDFTVLVEVPVSLGLARIAGRSGGREAGFEEENYLEKVRAAFDRQAGPDLFRADGRADAETILAVILAELRRRSLLLDEPPRFIDSHCHLAGPEFAGRLDEVLARARAAGVTEIFNVGLGPDNCRAVLAQAAGRPELRPVLGWHPHEAEDFSPKGLRELLELAGRPEVAALGEIGLDFAVGRSGRAAQLLAFESLLDAAAGLDRPVVIHSREALDDTLRLLRKYAPSLRRGGLIHCFTLGLDAARAYLDLGFHLSLPGVLTYPQSRELRAAVRELPDDRLLVETDAPYLAPVPFRGRRNEPAHILWTLKALAEAKGWTLNEAARRTTANTRALFGPAPGGQP